MFIFCLIEVECDVVFIVLFDWMLCVDGFVLVCSFCFVDFVVVFGFMMCVVLLVEKVDYYFEWLNVWN